MKIISFFQVLTSKNFEPRILLFQMSHSTKCVWTTNTMKTRLNGMFVRCILSRNEFDHWSFSTEHADTQMCVTAAQQIAYAHVMRPSNVLFACWENSGTLCRHNFITSMHASSLRLGRFGWIRFDCYHSYYYHCRRGETARVESWRTETERISSHTVFGGWMTDCAMHFPLCTHLSDSYQHCFYADIAFVYLLLSDVCRAVRSVRRCRCCAANVPWKCFVSNRRFVLEWPCRGGEILLILCDAGNGCWSCAHHLLSSASSIVIKTICLGFYMGQRTMMISAVATHTAIGIQWFYRCFLVVLAGNHMEISYCHMTKKKEEK